MELRRNRHLPLSVFMVSGGLLMLLCGLGQEWWRVIIAVLVGGGAMLAGGIALADAFSAFRVHIGSEGLTVKLKRIDRLVRWDEVCSLVPDFPKPAFGKRSVPQPRLLLVPSESAGSDLRPTEESPLDGRSCLVLFEFHDVKDTPERVAEALKRFAGDRFTDSRQVLGDRFAAPDFTIVLRGYDPEKVDELVRKGRQALALGRGLQRITAKAEIEGASLPIAMRGYDREQVDAFLRELSAELATLPSD